MEDSSESSVSPYILRVMSNSKMLDILSELASCVQVLIDSYMWPVMHDTSNNARASLKPKWTYRNASNA